MASAFITEYHYFLILLTCFFSSQKGKTWTIYAIISIALKRRIRDVFWKHCSRLAGYALKKHISSLFIFTAAVLSIKAVKLEYVCLCPPTLACFVCRVIVTFRSYPCLCGFCFLALIFKWSVSKSTLRKLHESLSSLGVSYPGWQNALTYIDEAKEGKPSVS